MATSKKTEFFNLFQKKKVTKVTNYVIEWMGLNFDVYPVFQKIPCYA